VAVHQLLGLISVNELEAKMAPHEVDGLQHPNKLNSARNNLLNKGLRTNA